MPPRINPRAVIEANPFIIAGLLQKDFLIPEYQRDYVWKEGQVKELWNDLRDHYLKSTDNDNLKISPDAYFLGSMMLVKRSEDNKLEVIDGQQRLTTLTCITAVLLEFLKDITDVNVDGEIQQLETMLATYSAGDWIPRLCLSEIKVNQFLLNTCKIKKKHSERIHYWESDTDAIELLSKPKSPATLIKNCIVLIYDAINQFVQSVDETKRTSRIKSLYSIFSECVVVLLIEAQTISTAYELFESLNYRGMPLTQADLIKNEVIKSATTDEDRDLVLDNWINIKENLESHDLLNLPDFLYTSYISTYSPIKASHLFNSVKEVVRTRGSVSYTDLALCDAKSLTILINGCRDWKDETNQALYDLHKVLNIKLTYVALLSVARMYGSDKNRFDEYVQAIVNFSFRFMKIIDGDVAQLSSVMCEISRLINDGKDISVIRATLLSHAPNDKCIERFKDLWVNSSKLGYYIVYRLESPRLHGTMPVNHGEDQHLEHIMPQKPGVRDWPEAKAAKSSNPAEFKEYLWRIGNLLPLPQFINNHIKNKKIGYKIRNSESKSYNDCHLISPKEVESYLEDGKWTYNSIIRHQNDLATRHFVNAWPL